jgi:hypothetical protein
LMRHAADELEQRAFELERMLDHNELIDQQSRSV